ncbi:uncharacterized protein LOC129203633 [Grus americana]|uniref:uncharacterized protein LOC129203633 n=1 Tax=Grus americana TaxID=9117 RepID=UPI0024079D57|nr:uncharacterized protein LOC129203633 [Grus americana]
MGLWASWAGGGCPCPWQGWHWVGWEVPSTQTRLGFSDVSGNAIAQLGPLAALKALTVLNLSRNRIASLEPLGSCHNLQSLNLAGNRVSSLQQLRCLTGLRRLESLRLRDPLARLANPLCAAPAYRAALADMFPGLKAIDGERVSGRGSELYRLCRDLDSSLGRGGVVPACVCVTHITAVSGAPASLQQGRGGTWGAPAPRAQPSRAGRSGAERQDYSSRAAPAAGGPPGLTRPAAPGAAFVPARGPAGLAARPRRRAPLSLLRRRGCSRDRPLLRNPEHPTAVFPHK